MKTKFSLLLLFLFLGTGLQAQTVDSVIDTYFEKNGGKEAFSELSAMKIEGSIEQMGATIPFTLITEVPDKQKMTMSVQGSEIVMAYDGETAWQINPMQGVTEPTKLTGPMAANMKENSFDEKFLHLNEEGYEATLEGEETVNEKAAFKIAFKAPEKEVEYHFIDKEDYTRVMVRSFVSGGPYDGSAVETYFGEYSEVGEVLMPHSIKVRSMGQTVMSMAIESYDLDIELDEAEFAMDKN